MCVQFIKTELLVVDKSCKQLQTATYLRVPLCFPLPFTLIDFEVITDHKQRKKL